MSDPPTLKAVYIKAASFGLDLEILRRTALLLGCGRGSYRGVAVP